MRDPVQVRMFERAYLNTDTASGFVERFNSHAVPVQGNAVMANATLINSVNLSGTDALQLTLEGSYDGRVWLTTGLSGSTVEFSTNTPDNQSFSSLLNNLDYAYVRMRAAMKSGSTATNVEALFDASIVLSHQV